MNLIGYAIAQTATTSTTTAYLSLYSGNPRLDPNTFKMVIVYAFIALIIALIIRFFTWKSLPLKVAALFFFAIALFSVGYVVYRNVILPGVQPVFSVKDMLSSTWTMYKINYMDVDTGRVLDRERSNITTSEGESYAMLRAVWMDDRVTFDRSWEWTANNLMHNRDSLFSWLYGTRSNGTLGILTEIQGQNSASDADTDIALSLLFAYARWQDPKYLSSAEKIINGIWQNEVIMIGGRPYMASDNVEKNGKQAIIVNPSYLVPYAYRIFAKVDTTHDWNALVTTSYEVIAESISNHLDKDKSAYIPPDWVVVDIRTGEMSATGVLNLTTNYSYDALRVPWRIGLDYAWYGDGRAETILKQFGFLANEWKNNRLIHSEYEHDGTVIAAAESPAMYGGSLAALARLDPKIGRSVYEEKLVTLFNPDSQSWKVPLGYYNENWAWFGVALYNNLLPNLWEGGATRR